LQKSHVLGKIQIRHVEPVEGSQGDRAMHGATTKALLKSASVIALLCGGLLLPSPASAQFNFPNIQFRVPYVGPGGHYNYRTRHHKVHERKSRGHREEEEEEPAEHEKSSPQPLSAPIKDTRPPAGGSPPAAKPAGGEEPTFSPSR
jgi:hypothetical protein